MSQISIHTHWFVFKNNIGSIIKKKKIKRKTTTNYHQRTASTHKTNL